MVSPVDLAPDEARLLGAIDQLDGGVVAEHEVLSELADRGVTVVPPDG